MEDVISFLNPIIIFVEEQIQYFALLFSGILTSFIVKVVDINTPDTVRPRWLLPICSLVASVMVVILVDIDYPTLPYVVVYTGLNVIVAMVFYHYAGTKIVDRIAGGLKWLVGVLIGRLKKVAGG